MTYLSDATPVTYHSDGPVLPGEDVHQAMGENTAYSLGGHMLNRPAQGVSAGTFSQPGAAPADAHPMAQGSPDAGHGYEDEPVDAAERAAQRTAQNAARDLHASMFPGAFPLSHAEVASNVRQALRYGAGA